MILWSFKLFQNVRKAIAGRQHPSQLAWAVAWGFLLGVIPHGNLLAIVLLFVMLSLKINHATAVLTAAAATFLAPYLDWTNHATGDFLLRSPVIGGLMVKAWQWPLMPWTDLNNTIVLGSATLGLAAMLPLFMTTYPIFRLLRSRQDAAAETAASNATVTADQRAKQQSLQPSSPPTAAPAPKTSAPIAPAPKTSASIAPAPKTSAPIAAAANTTAAIVAAPAAAARDARRPAAPDRVPAAATAAVRIDSPHDSVPSPAAIETRIDVIRVRDAAPGEAASPSPGNTSNMDEALNFLLRQLRDSQQRNAA